MTRKEAAQKRTPPHTMRKALLAQARRKVRDGLEEIMMLDNWDLYSLQYYEKYGTAFE